MYPLLFNLAKIIIKSISITHPLNLDFRITNNPRCIVYEHSIGLKITGHFLKRDLLALNRLNNNRANFEVRSPIEIRIMPRPGIGQSIPLTGYSSGLTYFN